MIKQDTKHFCLFVLTLIEPKHAAFCLLYIFFAKTLSKVNKGMKRIFFFQILLNPAFVDEFQKLSHQMAARSTCLVIHRRKMQTKDCVKGDKIEGQIERLKK